jgi:hypothetical protein
MSLWPFEGAGAISTWDLALPKSFQQFDYQTIGDVILHVSYTADFDGVFRDAVEQQNAATAGTLLNYLANQPLKRALSFRQDFSGAFHQLLHSPIDTDVKIQLSEKYFPIFLTGQRLQLVDAQLALKTKAGQTLNNVQIAVNATVPPAGFAENAPLRPLRSTDVTNAFVAGLVQEHAFTIKNAGDLAPAPAQPGDQSAIDSEKLLDVVLYLEYKIKTGP